MPADVLTLRQLNRATLARQLLLERRAMGLVDAVEHLLGLQAQIPRPPFVSLWSRLTRVDRKELVDLLCEPRLVRATTMRGTLHVMSAADYGRFRTTLQAGLDSAVKMLGDRIDGVDIGALVKEGRRFFKTPRSFESFRDHLVEQHPGGDIRAMAYAVRTRLPMVQVPGNLPWAFTSSPEFMTADTWLGKAPAAKEAADALVVRYLAAYGPATASDAQSWLGLPGVRPVLDRLRPGLQVFKGEGRAELFDLPDAPRPAEDTPAPVRFLPEWDSAIVSRADARFVRKADRPAIFRPGLRVLATVLIDGLVEGTWTSERKRKTATLTLELFSSSAKRVRTDLEKEAEALLRFIEPDASDFDVRIA